MRKLLGGLGSLILVVGFVVGIPLGLVAVAGNPLTWPWGAVADIFTVGYVGERFFMGILIPLIGWVVWAIFTIPFLFAIPGAVSDAVHGIRAPRGGVFGVHRRAAGVLIGAIVLMFAGGTAAVAAPADSAMAAPVSVASEAAPAIPASAPAPAPAPAPMPAVSGAQHTVVAGDTLWDLAQAQLGDGARYPEIFDASAGTVQPDGQQLTDPDLIMPGWQLTVPVASAAPASVGGAEVAPEAPAPAPAGSASEVAPAEAGPVSGAEAAASEAAAPELEVPAEAPVDSGLGYSTVPSGEPAREEAAESAPASAADAVDVTVDVDESDDEWAVVKTVGGISGLLAAGILGLLGGRRVLQRRRRRFSERIAMPSPELSEMELALRAVEDPFAIQDVDRALRFLGEWATETGVGLPELYAVRLQDDLISVFLAAPAQLPSPFVPASDDGQAWTLAPGALGEGSITAVNPFPALVTIGQDATDSHILIDLERWGAVNVVGDEELTTAALTALAMELTANAWADELQVTLVGVAPGLPRALDQRRVRHLDDVEELLRHLRAQIEDSQAALEAGGFESVAQARSSHSPESWAPEIVILGQLPSPELQEQLAQIVTQRPRLGIAAVAAGELAEGATMRLNSAEEAVLEPAGLTYAPQLVTPGELALLEGLIAVTDEPATPSEYARTDHGEFERITGTDTVADDRGAGLAHATGLTGDTTDEAKASESDADTDAATADDATADDAAADDAAAADAAAAAEEAAADADAEEADESAVAASVPEAAERADQVEAESPAVRVRPYLRILGPVGIDLPERDEASVAPAPGRGLELVAFLSLFPNATTEHYADQMFRGRPSDKQAESMKKLTHHTRLWLGETHLPKYTPKLGYRVQGVDSDWADFKALIGGDVTQTSTENLVAALRLVRGQPFTGIKPRFWIFTVLVQNQIMAEISDAADELARRARAAENHIRAAYAARLGNVVDPVNETAWRNLLLAALAKGDEEAFEQVVTDLEAFLDGFDEGYEPEPETQALIDQGRRELAGAGA